MHKSLTICETERSRYGVVNPEMHYTIKSDHALIDCFFVMQPKLVVPYERTNIVDDRPDLLWVDLLCAY